MTVTGLMAVSAGTAVAVPTSASILPRAAASCAYPYVCLFKDGLKIGQFQDVTTDWQPLPSQPSGTITITNTRLDDTAHIRFSTGSTICLPPEYTIDVAGPLTGIRISTAATC